MDDTSIDAKDDESMYLFYLDADGHLEYDGGHSVDADLNPTIRLLEGLPHTNPVRYWTVKPGEWGWGGSLEIEDITEQAKALPPFDTIGNMLRGGYEKP